MPFGKSAKVEVVNDGAVDRELEIEIATPRWIATL